jgi:hypothetical protein
MDPNFRIGQELFLQHRHGDGSWAQMERVEHDSAEYDAERSWMRGAIFRCTTCDEQVMVTEGEADRTEEPELP